MPTKPTNTIQKLRTVNTKKRVKSPIRSKSNTKQNKDVQLKAQIKQLKETTKQNLKTYNWSLIHKDANNKIWKLFK